jgi:hypothetical protein
MSVPAGIALNEDDWTVQTKLLAQVFSTCKALCEAAEADGTRTASATIVAPTKTSLRSERTCDLFGPPRPGRVVC